MTRKTGFTLIELLVVIAIIAILAAIIFPVFMRTREGAYRAGDMSQMNAIRNALQLYRADQEAYPPQILGYGTAYLSGPQMGQIIPASLLKAALYPKRINSFSTMKPAYDRSAENLVTRNDFLGVTSGPGVEWPNSDSRTVGQNPVLDLNGDGIIDNNDDFQDSRQLYATSNSPVYYCIPGPGSLSCVKNATVTQGDAAPLYMISGFDAAFVKAPYPTPHNTRWEVHYVLRWSNYALSGGNRQDDPRQLIYSEPPDNTVITWDSWFRNYDANNIVKRGKQDFVLFLGGGARPVDSADMSDRSWRLMP